MPTRQPLSSNIGEPSSAATKIGPTCAAPGEGAARPFGAACRLAVAGPGACAPASAAPHTNPMASFRIAFRKLPPAIVASTLNPNRTGLQDARPVRQRNPLHGHAQILRRTPQISSRKTGRKPSSRRKTGKMPSQLLPNGWILASKAIERSGASPGMYLALEVWS